jgi:MFS family permease
VLFAAGLFAHAFLYNFYLGELGFGEGVMGGAAASLTAGGLTALLPAGRLVDREGAGRAWVLACGTAFAGLAAGAWTESAAGIYGSAFVAGMGTATWRVSMGPLLMGVASAGMRTRAFSWNVALLLGAGSVWTALAGALPGWIGAVGGLGSLGAVRVALMVGAVTTLLGAAPIVAGRFTRATGSPARVAGPAGPGAGVRRVASALRVPRPVAAFVAVVAVWMLAGGLVLPFFNVYFLREHGLEVGGIGILFAGAQAVTAVAVYASGHLAGRAGPRRPLLAWALLFAPLLLGLGLTAAAPLAIALFVLQGFVPPATNPLIDQLLLEGTAPDRYGAVSTWRNAATEVSGLAGAAVGGALLEATSFGTLFIVAGCVAAAGFGGLGWAMGRLAGREAAVVVPAAT